jgi:hypothetical protein
MIKQQNAPAALARRKCAHKARGTRADYNRIVLVQSFVALTDKSFLFLFFKKESAFFFEKKKQKNFVCLALNEPPSGRFPFLR